MLAEVARLPAQEIPEGFRIVEIPMTAEERRRVHRKVIAPDGRVLLLALPTGSLLRPGQVLWIGDGVAYRVAAAEEAVLVIRPRTLEEAVRLGHFLGNLHRDIYLDDGEVCILYEEVLHQRLLKLGFRVRQEVRPFYGTAPGEHAH